MSRIVELNDTEPLLLDPSDLDGPVWICCCGLSADWPYCDGSHGETRREKPGRVYAYHRKEPGGRLHATELPEPHPVANPRPGD